MVMHHSNRRHSTRPRTVVSTPDLAATDTQEEMVEWLSTARGWSPDTAPTWTQRLRNEGVRLPAPDAIAEKDMPRLSQRLILCLAERGVYLSHTDHLSDRALYTYLIETALAIPGPPRQPGSFELIDLCPPYGRGIELMLACYASEDMRQQLSLQGVEIPPRIALVADRDRSLPKPPQPPPGFD
ncbi:MAG: hypothetical protein QGG74_01395 [Phycisphaerales bacterium]|nr:hypothetical protein [Phycisphaerales bacterium]